MSEDEKYCYDCIHNEVCRWHPHDGCDFKETVKHGRWEVRTQKDGTTIGQHNVTYCSECGYVLFTKEDSFCARCGAKMDVIYQDDKIKAVKVVGWEGDNE